MLLRREAAWAIVVSLLFHGVALGVVTLAGYSDTELQAVEPLTLKMMRIEEHSETAAVPKTAPPAPPPRETPPAKAPAPKNPQPKPKAKKVPVEKRISKNQEAIVPQDAKLVEKPQEAHDGEAEVAKADYEKLLAAMISSHKRYPRIARRRGQEGEGLLRLSVLSSGTLAQTEILRSTGSAILDKEMKAMVERAAPFPPFPNNLRRRAISFIAPIRFQLR